MIESNYQNNTTSKKGAGGAWQLMPKTASDYGINKESRYQFTPATEAALNLLDSLHKQFGSWELTFSAYNSGASRVEKALRKNPEAKSIQELDLPQETKDYVTRIININQILAEI